MPVITTRCPAEKGAGEIGAVNVNVAVEPLPVAVTPVILAADVTYELSRFNLA
jgi:hypothetical protein